MRMLIRSIVFAAVAAVFTPAYSAERIDREACFDFSGLSQQQRMAADQLLLKALDSEALYTIAGGLKPMSSGFANFSFPEREPRDDKRRDERDAALRGIADHRAILDRWRCGWRIYADVQHFSRTFEGKRMAEAVVFDRTLLERMLRDRSSFFLRWGLTAPAHPLSVLYAVENSEKTERFAGYGHLFGYPEHAVKFFVQAAMEEDLTGRFVERDFHSIPTFMSATNRFVYAVPKGHIESPGDKAIRERAESILKEYTRRRAEYIGEGKRGVVELVRDWLCRKDDCSAQHAAAP